MSANGWGFPDNPLRHLSPAAVGLGTRIQRFRILEFLSKNRPLVSSLMALAWSCLPSLFSLFFTLSGQANEHHFGAGGGGRRPTHISRFLREKSRTKSFSDSSPESPSTVGRSGHAAGGSSFFLAGIWVPSRFLLPCKCTERAFWF